MDDASLFSEPNISIKAAGSNPITLPKVTTASPITYQVQSSAPSISTASPSAPFDAESKRLLPLIPREILRRPMMPTDAKWRCPVRGCTQVFDFRERLPLSVLRLLSLGEKEFLKRKAWSAKSPEAARILVKVTAPHFNEHLKEIGLILVNVSVP